MMLECTGFQDIAQNHLPKEPVYGRKSCGTCVPWKAIWETLVRVHSVRAALLHYAVKGGG